MKKPRILITSRSLEADQTLKCFCNETYINALQKTGALVFIYPWNTVDALKEIVSMFDGLVITGGKDVDSAYYSEPLDPLADCEISNVDQTDLELIRGFAQARKPILGICRGLQILNVAFGGSLYQDLNTSGLNLEENHHSQNHAGKTYQQETHVLTIEPDSFLSSLMGPVHHCNSYHHQAIKRLAEGFKPAAYSDDGLIEAIEKDNIIAVQWHPEWLCQNDEKQRGIFTYFIELCQKTS